MIQLNYRDAKPIYEQIKDGLRKLVITNSLIANEKLPSVREMASKLAINPNTIQKAYRELEAEQEFSFGIGDHHGTVALHDVDYSVCPAFSSTGTAHHKDIQISFMLIAVQSHAEVLG